MEHGSRESITLTPGSLVAGKYQVVRCLGVGSMSIVYLCRAMDQGGEFCALKILSPSHPHETVSNFLARFRNGILAAQRINHPHVVKVLEYIEQPEVVACALEYVNGGDLASMIRAQGALQIQEVVRIMRQLCSGVQAVHEAGIIHRDLKPANIMLTKTGDVKISDFGIARAEEGPKLTARGGVVGTIQYLSPQYLEGGEVSFLGDVYALGTIAYELVTGTTPHSGVGVFQLVELKVNTDPSPPEVLNPACPKELGAVILKALSRQTAKRYQSAREFGAALAELEYKVHTQPVRQSRALQQPRNTGEARMRVAPLRVAFGGVLLGMLLMFLKFGVLSGRVDEVPEPMRVARNFDPASADVETAKSSYEFVQGSSRARGKFETQGVPAVSQSQFNLDRGDSVPMTIDLPQRERAPFVRPQATLAPKVVKPIATQPERVQVAALVQPKANPAVEPTVAAERPAVEAGPAEPSAEYRVRGTLLYRIADYVDWPASAFSSPDEPMRVCLLGKDPFGITFDRLLSKASTRTGRGFSVARYTSDPGSRVLSGCHVLYISESEDARAGQILSRLRRSPVLAITEGNDEGIFDFVISDGKVKFTVNKRRAREAGLQVGTLLLDLAVRVTEL